MENGTRRGATSRQVPPTSLTMPIQPRVGKLAVRSQLNNSMNQGFPDVDTDDIKLNWIPSHATTSTNSSATTTNNFNISNLNNMTPKQQKSKKQKIVSRTNSGNEVKNETSGIEAGKEEEKSCSFWIKKLFSHRILWFLILMPVYVVFIIVTIIFSTSVAKGNDPESYSPADTFFGITYILFMSTVLAFVLRYFCHKCDHESRQCTCPPEQLIHEVVRKQQNNPKRRFLERPQPFISKKNPQFPFSSASSATSYPIPQLV